MSAIKDLLRKRVSLEDQLEAVNKSINDAIIASAPVAVGDLVKLTSETHSWRTNGSVEKVEYGRVRSIGVRYGNLEIEVAPKTKSGFHAVTNINGYGKKLEKVTEIPA